MQRISKYNQVVDPRPSDRPEILHDNKLRQSLLLVRRTAPVVGDDDIVVEFVEGGQLASDHGLLGDHHVDLL